MIKIFSGCVVLNSITACFVFECEVRNAVVNHIIFYGIFITQKLLEE